MSGNKGCINNKVFLLICFFALIKTNAYGSFSRTKAKIESLKSSVQKFNRMVESTNSQFSKIIDLKNQLFTDIDSVEEQIESTDNSLNDELKKFKKVLLRYEALDYSVDENEAKLLTVRNLKVRKKAILERKNKLKELRKNLVKIQDKISDYEFLEVDLIKKIEDINTKSKKAKLDLKREEKKFATYKKTRARRKKISKTKAVKESLKSQVVKKENNPSFSMTNPLSNPKSIEKDGSGGLSYSLSPKQLIIAPKDGLVIYSGRLSKYGNVIVIKHDGGYRTILLGKFMSSVIKGQKVRVGEKIATALETSSKEDKLYFELRKNKKKINASKYVKNNI